MCGIVGVFDLKKDANELRPLVLEMSKKLRHRGPDWSGIYCGEKAIIAHERLSIVDPQSGGQPLYSKDRRLILGVNGEIYNHREIRERYRDKYEFMTMSDCEVILALYADKGKDFLDELNGIFAFVLYDEVNDCYLAARDHMGIVPLYIGWDIYGNLYFASELKALEGTCRKIEAFPPGHYLFSRNGEFTKWYQRDWVSYDSVKDGKSDISTVARCTGEGSSQADDV